MSITERARVHLLPPTAAPQVRLLAAELYVFGQQLDGDPCCWPGTAVTASAFAGAAAVAGGSGDASGGRTGPPSHASVVARWAHPSHPKRY